MNCIIPGANMKVLSKAIQALSKIGDELHLEAMKDYMMLRSVNMTTTAYCTFKFFDTFFSSYEVEDSENGDDLGCMIPMKALLGLFKPHGHKDKKPEICKIELEHNAGKIVFKLKYKHDVVVERSLYLNDGQIVNVTYSKTTSNQVSANAQLFAQVLSNFQMGDEDMGMEVSASKALMRNYITEDTNKPKGIRSQISLTAGEFNSFKIGKETCITYSLKPFRAAVHFAETFSLPVFVNFETSGRPAVLVIKNPTFEVNFVIATLNTEHASQSSLASTPAATKKKNQRIRASKVNITLQDQQVLESVNWDVLDMQTDNTAKKKTQFNDLIDKVRTSVDLSDNNICNSKNLIKDQPRISKDRDKNEEHVEIIPGSPESPRSKRIKTIFGRCYEDTFHPAMMDLGEILAPDSDTEAN